jgi:hypothetical protein
MGEKFKMFFTTFSSQNPSEKIRNEFYDFLKKLTAIIQTGLRLKMIVKNSKLFSTHPEAFHCVFRTTVAVASQRICAV